MSVVLFLDPDVAVVGLFLDADVAVVVLIAVRKAHICGRNIVSEIVVANSRSRNFGGPWLWNRTLVLNRNALCCASASSAPPIVRKKQSQYKTVTTQPRISSQN